jgi:diguanylate cyclase (GGDEF)-like protein
MVTRFTPGEEQRYAERVASELVSKLRWAFLVAAGLFVSFIWVDFRLDPGILPRNVPVRLITVAGFVGLHLLSRRTRTLAKIELLLLAAVVLGAASVTRLSVGMERGPIFAVGSLLLMVVMMAGLIPTVRNAIAGHVVLLLTALTTGALVGAERLFFEVVTAFVLAGSGAGLIMAAVSERLSRRAFRLELDLEVLATRDALTGVYNRRAFLERTEQELLRVRRTGHPLALLVLDIDSFKAINDTHGHPAGDEVIRQLARSVESTLRATDFVGRLGGEEFAVTLPETNAHGALQLAERLRIAVSEARPFVGGLALPFTVSVGVAISNPEEPLDRLLSRGDEALYAAKRGGRNKVCAAARAA